MEMRNTLLQSGGEVILVRKVAKNWAELCSSALWKVNFVGDDLGYLAEDIPKQSVKGVAWFLLAACSKTIRGDKLKKELLSNRESELEVNKILSPSLVQ